MCGGIGWYSLDLPVGHPQFGRALPCECQARRRAEILQAVCGLNEDERLARLGDVVAAGPGTAAMLDAARAFIAKPAGILTVWGKCGNAKTTVLQAIVNECLDRNLSAVYVTLYDLINWVRDAFRDDTDSAWGRVHRLTAVSVLCIDEFDKIKITEWSEELQTAVLDRRYRDGLSGRVGTVLAMNSDPNHLPEWIYSRLCDGRNRIVHNADPDLRPRMR